MSSKEAKTKDPQRASAIKFFDALKKEGENPGSIRKVSTELDIRLDKALEWFYLTRPASINAGKNWPYGDAEQEAYVEKDSIKKAEAQREADLAEEQTEAESVSIKDIKALAEDKDDISAGLGVSSVVALENTKPVARTDSKAIYLEDKEAYLVFLEPRKPPVYVTQETHRAMRGAYSNWNNHPVKASDIAKTVGLTPSEFLKYKSIFGWTRDMAPMTDPEMAALSEEEVIATLSDMKTSAVQRRWDKINSRIDARDAHKWRDLKHTVIDELSEAIKEASVLPKQEAKLKLNKKKTDKKTLLIPLNDWQVGAYAKQEKLRYGQQFDADVFRAIIDDYIDKLDRYVAREDALTSWNKPVIALLGDLIHGMIGETVHGTKLAKTMHLFDWEQVRVCLEALYKICDHVVDLFGGFELISVPGNHEGYVAQVIAEALKQRYSNFDCSFAIPENRTYQRMIQNSYFTFDHGASPESQVHGGKIPRGGHARDSIIKSLIATRADLLAKAKENKAGVYFVMGDQHHVIDESMTGVEIIKLPALPTGDIYADENSWYSRSSQAVLLIGDDGVDHMQRFYFDNIAAEVESKK